MQILYMKSMPTRYMKTLSWKPYTLSPIKSCDIYSVQTVKDAFKLKAHEKTLRTQLLSDSRSHFSFLTSSVAHSAAASLNIYAALCCCMPAVSLCVALCVLSYSLCCASLLSIRQSTHGTDPTSSRQPRCPTVCRCTDLTVSLTVQSHSRLTEASFTSHTVRSLL